MRRFALTGWLALIGAGCGSTAPAAPEAGVAPVDAANDLPGDGPAVPRGDGPAGLPSFPDASAGGAEDGPDGGAATPLCGFVMPNPVAANLPHPAAYDTSVPGVVLDQVSGLMWQRQVTGHATASAGCTVNLTGLMLCPYRYAAVHCQESRLGGHDDWRLPTILELISLMDFTQRPPQIDQTAFPDSPAEPFWSSTRQAGRRDYAHLASLGNSDVRTAFIDEPHRVRCVRTGSAVPPRCAPASGRFQVTTDLVTDSLTSLSWRRAAAAQTMTFASAASYCSGLGSGFRLPSIKELFTILDFTRSASAEDVLDRAIWQGPQDSYWSSSVNVLEYMSAWTLDFDDTRPAIAGFTNSIINVRCVR